MADLWRVGGAAKIRILGPSDLLDSIQPPDDRVGQGRVAPDEIVWLADPGRQAELVAAAEAKVASAGTRAIVVDHSDGWALFSLVGEGAREALARVSSLRTPTEGFVQGQVAQAPGKVFCRPDRLDVLIGSDLAWFVGERLEHAGHGVGLHVAEAPEANPVSGGVA